MDEEAVETAMVRAGRESAGDGREAYLRLVDEIITDYPYLQPEDIHQALAYGSLPLS